MKFHTLNVENFLTLRTATVNLDGRGLQLIQGANEDDSSASSNGAGKSSLVDAICWCLYGITARDVKGDSVVNLGAKKNCMVSLTVSNGSARYRITRYRKHATGKNSLVVEDCTEEAGKGEPTDLSRGTDAETQKVVEKILGASREVFMSSVYCGQEAMPDLPRMKDRELKTLIEESAGMSRIESAYEISRKRLNDAKAVTTSASIAHSNAEVAHNMASGALEEIHTRRDMWEADRDARVLESAGLLETARKDLELLEKQHADYLPGAEAANNAIAEIDAKLADHKTLLGRADTADAAVRKAELAVDASGLKRMDAAIKEIERQIVNAAEEIKKPCRECGTVLETMSIGDFVAHKEKHLTTARADFASAKTRAAAQIAEIKSLREAAASYRAAVPDVTELTKSRVHHAVAVQAGLELVGRRDRKRADVAALTEQVVMRRTEKNPHQAGVEASEKRLADASAKVAAAKVEYCNAVAAEQVAADVVKVFGPAGVRAQILDAVTPFLNLRTGRYLTTLTDGAIQATWTTLTKDAKGDLKEKFSVEVVNSKGADSFAGLSGGEKRKVRIACALALQDLVASRATQPIDLFIGDEMDDALDPAGLERLMALLEEKGRERGTVMIISHSDLKDWCDNVTTVRKSGGSSTVEGSLCL